MGKHGLRTINQRLVDAWRSMNITWNADELTAFVVKARLMGFGYPLGDEYKVSTPDGVLIAGQCFAPGVILETEVGRWGPDDIQVYDLLRGTSWIPGPGPGPGPLPYAFPKELTAIGAVGVEGKPIPGQPFYRLAGAAVRRGVNAFAVVTLLAVGGRPVIGASVVNVYPDGNGEVQLTDGSGAARFMFGANSAFSDPGGGEFAMFVVDQAVKDNDAVPKVLRVGNKLSDEARSLGDWQAEHTEIYLQFVQQP